MSYLKWLSIFISLYFISGFLVVWFDYFTHFNLLDLFNALFPASVFIIITFFFLYVGLVCLLSKNQIKIIKLLSTAFLLQVVQFSFFGFVFENYFGPYVSIGLYFEPFLKFDVNVSLYSWLFSNGYSENSQSRFFLNLIPLLLWLLFNEVYKGSLRSKSS
jgi:hypothetical protein